MKCVICFEPCNITRKTGFCSCTYIVCDTCWELIDKCLYCRIPIKDWEYDTDDKYYTEEDNIIDMTPPSQVKTLLTGMCLCLALYKQYTIFQTLSNDLFNMS